MMTMKILFSDEYYYFDFVVVVVAVVFQLLPDTPQFFDAKESRHRKNIAPLVVAVSVPQYPAQTPTRRSSPKISPRPASRSPRHSAAPSGDSENTSRGYSRRC